MNCELREYIDNLKTVSETMSIRVMPEMSDDDIIRLVHSSAEKTYALHCRNDEIVSKYVTGKKPEDLSEDEIKELEEFSGVLSEKCDHAMCYKVNQLLHDCAVLKDDLKLLVKSCYYMGLSLFYMRVVNDKLNIDIFGAEMQKCFMEGASCFARYEETDDAETRAFIIRCLANCRLGIEAVEYNGKMLARNSYEWYCAYKENYDETMKILRSEKLQLENPEIPWDNYQHVMMVSFTSMITYVRSVMNDMLAGRATGEFYNQVAEEFYHVAEEVYLIDVEKEKLAKGVSSKAIKYRYMAAAFHTGRITCEELLDGFLKMYDESDKNDPRYDGIFVNIRLPAYMLEYKKYLSAESAEKYEERIKEASAGMYRYLANLPKNEYLFELSSNLRAIIWYRSGEKATYRRQILEFILACHPPTYIHSKMVSWLSKKIFLKMARENPEIFIGTLGVETAEDVEDRADELAAVIQLCGLYHDLGKCMIINHIGNYSRRLTDEEFKVIKTHPRFGYSLLEALGDYDDHAQGALHHHRNYDGSGGYPDDAGEIPTRVRKIVDILTVADSLEAGTDNVGRCYAATKTVDTLVGELRRWSGTRYSPEVVKVFDDEDFYESIKEGIATQRRKIYCEAYRNLGNIAKPD